MLSSRSIVASVPLVLIACARGNAIPSTEVVKMPPPDAADSSVAMTSPVTTHEDASHRVDEATRAKVLDAAAAPGGWMGPLPPILSDAGDSAAPSGLSHDIIRRVMRTASSNIKKCYQEGLRKDPNLAGKVTVTFTVDPKGMVQNAAARSSLADENVTSCVLGHVRSLRFPVSQGGDTTVTFPFVFKPDS